MQRASAWREMRDTGHLGQFIILCLGVWLHAADSFLAATAIPVAVRDIGGVAFINWTLALYALGAIVSGAGVGALARRFGMQAVLIAAGALYGIGCVASALAPDMGAMLIGRLVQGIGGGIMVALSYVATQRLFPEHLWTRLMAIVSAIWGASALCGPLIGGAFAAAGLWRGAFWAFGGQAGVLILVSLVFLRGLPADGRARGGWPWKPLLVLTVATVLIAAAGAIDSLAASAGCVVLGGLLLYAAARVDAQGPDRLMPLEVLHPRHPVGAGLLMVLALAAGSTVFTNYGPLLLGLLFGVGPLGAGYIIAAESIIWTLATLATAGASPRWEVALIRTGTAAILAGGVGLMLFVSSGPVLAIIASVLLQGGGFGMCWPFVVRRIVAFAPGGERDLAASATSSMQRIGYALGASASGIAANAAGLAHGPSLAAAHAAGFWVFAAFVPVLGAGCLAAWRLTRPAGISGARALRGASASDGSG